MFEKAARLKLRFQTSRGLLSVEDLWDLPLTSKTGQLTLDQVAKDLHRELKASAEETSFVEPHAHSKSDELQLGFDIVKHVIEVRLVEQKKSAEALLKRETKKKILEIIESKQDQELQSKSLEELKVMAEAM